MTGRIPQEFINQLAERVDIVSVIGEYVTLKKAGSNYSGLCPFHNERTPSFTVSPTKHFYYCFGCGVSGTTLNFLIEHGRMEFLDAINSLAERAGMEVPRTESEGAPKQDRQPLYDVLSRAYLWFVQHLQDNEEVQTYLEKRQLSPVVIKTFGLGFALPGWDNLLNHLSRDTSVKHLVAAGLVATRASEGRTYDRFRRRLIFPIRDVRGRVIAFGGRAIHAGDEPKYLNSPESPVFQKGSHLYGLYEAVADRSLERLLFVEGYMDVLALAQAGIAGSVASMGTAVTVVQLELAFRYVNEVVFCFDGDAAGSLAAWRTLERALPVLDDHRQIKFMFLPEGADPDSMVRDKGVETFRDLLKRARTLSDFLFDHLQINLDLSSIDGRARFSSLVKPLINKVKGEALRQLLTNKLTELTGLDGTTAPKRHLAKSAQPIQIESLARWVLRDLLLTPSVATALVEEDELTWLQDLEDDDAVLLARILRILKKAPTDKTAVLIAHFEGESDYEELINLCHSDMPLSQEQREEQLQAGWSELHKQAENKQRKRRLEEIRVQIEAQGHAPTEEQTAEIVQLQKTG